MIASLVHDTRIALRSLFHRPGFTAIALTTLALGIGANTAVFSVVNGILLRPLPYPAADRLMAVWPARFMSYQDLLFVRENAEAFSEVGGIVPGWDMTLTGSGEPAKLQGARPTANLFNLLGVGAVLGRTFQPDEGRPGADRVVVLSHRLWTNRFGADRSIIGRQLTLDGEAHTVVGVMPADFEIIQPGTEAWKPLALDPEEWYHTGGGLLAIGRLRPGASREGAANEFRALTQRLRETHGYPDDYGSSADVIPLHDRVVGDLRSTLLLLLGAVAFILLIAGANLGNLLLARASGRQHEIAVRTALGAGRLRLIRQLLTESGMLSLAGGGLGLLLAAVGVRLLARLLPADTPRATAIAVDSNTLLVCAFLAIATGLVFGLAPALSSTRELGARLRGARGVAGAGDLAGRRTRVVLVVGEVAIALVLLIGAGLMIQTLWRLGNVDPGFRVENLLTMQLQPTGSEFQSRARRLAFYSQLFERLEAAPNVRTVGAIQHIPLGGGAWSTDIEVDGQPLEPGATPPRVGWRVIGGDYIRAMEIPLLAGRDFAETDAAEAPQVVIVNQAMARQLWPDEPALGRRIRATGATGGEWATVIGVVGDVHHLGLDIDPVPELYRPLTQYPHGGMTLAIRTDSDPLSLARSLMQVVWSLSPDVPIAQVRSMEQVVGASAAGPRMIMLLLAVFAAVGLALGSVGIYGVLAYSVTQRRREIAVRMALGARATSVAGRFLWEGIRYAGIGIAIGLLAALLLSRSMAGLVFGVRTTDPVTFAALSLFLIGIAAVASVVPARRASRVDPMATLREE